MASKFGWTLEYIKSNVTMQQANRLVEEIQINKKNQAHLNTTCILNAVGYAYGSIDKTNFKNFMKLLETEQGTKRKKKTVKHMSNEDKHRLSQMGISVKEQ